jgi:hypothetical protein
VVRKRAKWTEGVEISLVDRRFREIGGSVEALN